MPRKLSQLTTKEAEALAEEAAGKLGYELVRMGRLWGYRRKSWPVGVVHASRHTTKIGALDAIIVRMGTELRRRKRSDR